VLRHGIGDGIEQFAQARDQSGLLARPGTIAWPRGAVHFVETDMHSFSGSIHWWFDSMDRARRMRGVTMDRLGYGPTESNYRTVLSTPAMRLRYYGGHDPNGPVALIVPAPIKRHYIWDISPERSVVQHALRAGMQVYLIEWIAPGAEENRLGLDEYGYALIDRCIDAIAAEENAAGRSAAPLFLLSHSLGGVFATIYAALQPQRIAGLVLVEAPLHFAGAAGSFVPLLALAPRADRVTDFCSPVPGSLLSLASMAASPATFGVERYADLIIASLDSHEALEGHWLVERWTLDETPMAGRLFEQVVEELYREDRLMLGRLTIAGRRIGPRDLVVPLLAVYDPRSVIIPPASMIAFCEAAASPLQRLLAYQGDTGVGLAHVGALVGRNAHATLWPDVFEWMQTIGTSRH
jgi:polyhydroxyalkanoate synthase